jgi:hypothetical protein
LCIWFVEVSLAVCTATLRWLEWGKKRHVLMIPCASRCTQEYHNRGDKIRVMRRGLGRALETTMQREKETTKLESSFQ